MLVPWLLASGRFLDAESVFKDVDTLSGTIVCLLFKGIVASKGIHGCLDHVHKVRNSTLVSTIAQVAVCTFQPHQSFV